jgi:hypothetical protein
MNWRQLMASVVLACVGPAAWCASVAEDRQALIMGISTYQDRQVRTLNAARTDIANARQMASAMGIAPQRMTVLQDAQVSTAAMEAYLNRLSLNPAQAGRLFVYFSGYGGAAVNHATQSCEPGIWTHDGNWLSFQRLHALLKPVAARLDKMVVLIDAGSATVNQGSTGKSTGSSASRDMISKTAFLASGGVKACQPKDVVKSRGQILKESDPESALQNLVYIASSMPNQTSWDETDGGAIATQTLRNCILGDAVDLDQSGAVSVDELQVCAAKSIQKRFAASLGQSFELAGNPHLIPVVRLEEAGPQALGAFLSSLSTEKIQSIRQSSAPVQVPAQASMDSAVATLNDIYQQRDPRKEVRVEFQKTNLKINRDNLQYTVRSRSDGYLYVFSLGSDAKSFYMLFPNGYDLNNAIGPNRSLTPFPMRSSGPAGTNRLLFIVTDQKRNFGSEALREPSKQLEFTQSLNTPQGRRALIDLTLGGQSSNPSSRFGAALHLIQESP